MFKRSLLILVLTVLIASTTGAILSVYTQLQSDALSPSLPEQVAVTLVYYFFLRVTGTLALVFIGVTMILGALRPIIIKIYRTAKFWSFHTRWMSSVGIGMVWAHLVIFLLYEQRSGNTSLLSSFIPSTGSFLARNNLVLLGLVAMLTVTMNAIITHIPGIMSKWWWRPLHVLNYTALVLILVHGIYLGTDSSRLPYKILYTFFGVLTLVGWGYRKYRTYYRPSTQPAPASIPSTVPAQIETPTSQPPLPSTVSTSGLSPLPPLQAPILRALGDEPPHPPTNQTPV